VDFDFLVSHYDRCHFQLQRFRLISDRELSDILSLLLALGITNESALISKAFQMFSSKNKIGVNLCWVFATFSVLLISSTDAALDLSDLTEEENMALQEELFNYELDKLTPEQKQLMQIKWETVKALVQQNCQYFQLGTNLTTYMVS